MVKVVSRNIGKREKPWRELVQMASEADADLAGPHAGGLAAPRTAPPLRLVRRGTA